MREIKMSDKCYEFISKLLEDSEIQVIANKKYGGEEYDEFGREFLTLAYDLFHKKKKGDEE